MMELISQNVTLQNYAIILIVDFFIFLLFFLLMTFEI